MPDLAADAGIAGDETLLGAAQKLLGYLWREAWDHAPGTLEGDADDLHDMRVAVRRLRSALQNFEGEKTAPFVAPHLWDEFQENRKTLGRLGDALGAVRDKDVLNEYLENYAKRLLKAPVDDTSSLGEFRRHLLNERADAFAAMVKRVNKAARPSGFKEEFARFSLGLPAASGPNPPLKGALGIILPQRKAEVLLHAPSLADPRDEAGQHELRKSLKRLRYTLEFFAPCFAFEVKPRVKQIAKLQDLLGEMQDRTVLHGALCDAFNVPLDDEATPVRALFASLPPDAAQFARYGHNRRRRLLNQARGRWQTLRDGFLVAL